MSTFLIQLIVSLLRAFIPAALEGSKPTMQDGDPALVTRKKARDRIRASWGKHLVFLIALSTLTGCLFTRTIYVPDGTPVRLRETIKDAKVWILDKDGNPVESEMDLPEGWFAVFVPPENK